MSDSDETTSMNSDHNDRFYDPEHTFDSPPSPSTASATPSTSAAAIATLIKTNNSTHTTIPPATTPTNPEITLCLHFRLGVPLQRSRSRKHIPAPVFLPFPLFPRPTFTAFLALLRSHTATVPRCYWPAGTNPYLQPAHSCSQWRYLELTHETFVGMIEKAWRTESKRVALGGKGERAAAHVYVYMVEEDEEDGARSIGAKDALGVEDTPVESYGGDEPVGKQEEEDEEQALAREQEERARELEERARELEERARVRELEERARELEERAREQEDRAREQEDRAQQQGVKRRAEVSNYGEGSSSFFSSVGRSGLGSGSGSVSGSGSGSGFLSFSSAKRTVTSSTMRSPVRPRQSDPSPSRRARHYEDGGWDGDKDEEEEEEEEEEEFRTIRLRVNGTVVNYEIELRSLREALGLALLGDGSNKRRRT
ncbi:hypothetical protein MVEG_05830 [Podila verticillata NRRL 6337]|nr:hypothetical protein MVEG_05830 [Podila verticillata NRRL 6337]